MELAMALRGASDSRCRAAEAAVSDEIDARIRARSPFPDGEQNG